MSTNRLVFSPNLTKVTQGDVLLRRVRIPKAAEKFEQTDRTLAYGEATGHSHTLTGGEVEFLKWQGKTYLRVLKECTLEHLKNFKTPTGEHNPIVFPPGEYQYGGTKAYDYFKEETRRVVD